MKFKLIWVIIVLILLFQIKNVFSDQSTPTFNDLLPIQEDNYNTLFEKSNAQLEFNQKLENNKKNDENITPKASCSICGSGGTETNEGPGPTWDCPCDEYEKCQNWYVRSTVNLNSNQWTDYCVGDRLTEYYIDCSFVDEVKFTMQDCNAFDSDTGWEYYCSGNQVRKKLWFDDFSCGTGECSYIQNTRDDQLVSSDGDSDFCAQRKTACGGCIEGQSDCDFNSECQSGLECVDDPTSFTEYCCPNGKQWNPYFSRCQFCVSETCNNYDDDCDGAVDESLSQSQGCGSGSCAGTKTATCVNGNWNWGNCNTQGNFCGIQDCDPLDRTCRDYNDVNRYCDPNGICSNPGCGNYVNAPSSTQCGSDYWEYGCPWGDSLDDDTGMQFHDFHCDGSGSCSDYPQGWQVDEPCNSMQYCLWDGSGSGDIDYYCYTCNDIDLDGYSPNGGNCGLVDCDDNYEQTYPGAPELCDGKDNDCNNVIDEGYTTENCRPVCESLGFVWTGNGGFLNCCGNNPSEDSPYETTELSCFDGNDNDCDGTTDDLDTDCQGCINGQQRDCPNQNGVCSGSKETCTNNQWPGCDYSTLPNYESVEISCDSLDNDCDGLTDENNVCGICGNGIIEGNEQCDDGANNGIPCNPGYGTNCNYCDSNCNTATVQGPFCGDNIVNGPETCELPNTNNNINCPQTTENCVGTKLQTRDSFGNCNNVCGCVNDSFGTSVCIKNSCGAQCAVNADCDDQNPNTVDTCNSCICDNTDPVICGDGNIDAGEGCDDGNTNSGDGCSSTCVVEFCGDGVTQAGLGEQCDDGANNGNVCVPGYGTSCDYCDAQCQTQTVQGDFCGDTVVNGPEDCELPNTNNNANCPQSTEQCTGNKTQTRDSLGNCDNGCNCNADLFGNATCVQGNCGATCDNNADCDDQNVNTVDTCNLNSCGCEFRSATCGDGNVEGIEECDDANLNNNDACKNDCTNNVCGDNVIWPGVQDCELPNTQDNQNCVQSTTQCSGNKTQTRDNLGDCNGNCGCSLDSFSQEACLQGSCNAECDDNNDCIDADPNTVDSCNLNICGCENILTCIDFDQDGYNIEGGSCGVVDCNDTEDQVNPGAAEVCDAIDNDCDQIINEGFNNENCQLICENNGYVWSNNGGSLNCCGNDAGEDSPYEILERSCFDGNDNDCDNLIDFNDNDCVAGNLQPYLINSTTITNVTQNELFNFISGVKCAGGECGHINVSLNVNQSYDLNNLPSYCISCSDFKDFLWISEVKINDNSKTSGNTFCSDYTSQVFATLNRGTNYTIFVTSHPIGPLGGSPANVDVWIDYDRSGSYENNELISLGSIYLDGDYTFNKTFMVPTNSSLDLTGMRVAISWGWSNTPCNTIVDHYGEVEDYTINIADNYNLGIIRMNSGNPFYTIDQNPTICINMNNGDTCNITWQVYATGVINSTWKLFAKYTPISYSQFIQENQTDEINITIIGSSKIFSILLESGWNLISFPVTPQNKSVKNVFSSVEGNYSSVFAYNSSDTGNEWKSFDPSRPPFLNTLKEVDETMGIWIKMTAKSSFKINGTKSLNPLFILKQGWNLIGYPSLDDDAAGNALSDVSGEYSSVFMYNASDLGDEWKSYDPNRPEFLNTLKNFTPGYGYWVKAKNDTNWTYDIEYKKI